MSNPLSNPQAPTWMGQMLARTRDAARRIGFVGGGGARSLRGWMMGLVVCALFAGGILFFASESKRSARNEGMPAVAAASETKAAAGPANAAQKQNSKRVEKKVAGKKKSEEKKAGSNGQSEPVKSAGSGVQLREEVQLSPSGLTTNSAEGEGEGADTVRARANWFHDQRAYPYQHIPPGALQEAIRQRDLMKQAQAARSGSRFNPQGIISFPGDALWHLMGPKPVNELFSVNSGFPTASGRVTAIAVDPSDATGKTVYIGGAAGGVWKTTDAGANWAPLMDRQPSMAIGSITVDPNNSNTIYVGTGEENFNGDHFYGAGILKSVNGGTTWTQIGASTFAQVLGPTTGGALIGQIAVQPGNSSNVLAAVSFFVGGTVGGIYRSTDAGLNWTEDAAPQGVAATAVVFESTSVGGNTAIAWAAMGNPFGEGVNGIYRSTDSGLTWTKQVGGLPTVNLGRITLGYAPSTAGVTATVYAAIADSSTNSSNLLSLVKTVNGGSAWSTLTGPSPGFCNSGATTGQCFYDMAVGVHPTNANFVVLGGGAYNNNSTSLFKSTNGGATWTNSTVGTDFTLGTNTTRPHVDTHAFAFAANGANPFRFYVGNDGGVWRTDDPTPTPPTWVDLNATLAITQFYPGPSAGIADENYGFGGTQDNDTELFSGALAWDNVFACGDGGFTAIDPNIPTTVYTTCDRGASHVVRQSVFNGSIATGQTFNAADAGIVRTDRMQFIPPLTIDENNPTTLYFGSCRVWQTLDGGATWNPLSGDLSAGNATPTTCPAAAGNPTITSFDVAHQSSSIVLAGTSNGTVWETTTGGALWNQIDGGLLPNRHVTAVRTKRNDATGNIAYVTFSGFGACGGCGSTPGHVFKTTNATAVTPTWTNISGDLPDIPVNDLIVDHDSGPLHDALYIATDVGVFSCPDPEAATPCTNWTVVGDGLPNSPVLGLALRRNSRILRAATHGRSMWNLQLTDVSPPPLALLSFVTPAAVMAGAATTAVTVTGLNFSTSTQVLFNFATTGVTTTFVNTTQLNVTLNSSLLQVGGVFPITLTDPAGVDSGSAIGTGGLPFSVMNPILNPQTMTPSTALTYTPVHLHLTGTNFVPGTVLSFYDTSVTPVLQFQLQGGTPTAGGTVFDLTTDFTQFTIPFTYNVVPFNPTPGGGISPASLAPFPLTITANPGPIALFVPSSIVLGPINVGANTSITTFQIQNPGSTTALSITNATITGTNAANFAFVAPTMAPSCNFENTKIFTVPAGTACFFGMKFTAGTPPGNANSTATLNVTDNAPGSPQAVSVTGLINTSIVLVTPVNFGSVGIGATSATMPATLINFQPSTLNVTSTGFTITGANAADFHLVSATPPCALPPTTFTVPSNGQCNVGVSFTPSILGNETATINVSDDGPGSPQNAPLFGVGVQITSISPSIVATGGPAFTLTVNGGGFAPSAVVNVNGSARLTTFVNATQLIASIPASDIATAGNLAISVTTPNPGGTASEPKTLVVAQAPSATNDNINFATNAAATPFRISQDTTHATTQLTAITTPANMASPADPTPGCAPSSRAKSVWFLYQAPGNGRVVADTRFSTYATNLSVWTVSPALPNSTSAFTAIACASGNVPGTPVESLVGFAVTSGQKYYLMVADASGPGLGGTLTFSLDFANVAPSNDDNATPTVIASAPFSGTVNSILATANTNAHADPALPGGCATGAASSGQANSVWYRFTAPGNGTITADTLTSPYDTILNVTSGSAAGTQVICNDSAGAGIAQSQVSFGASSGTIYFFMVSAFLGDGGTTNFHLTFAVGALGVPATIAATSGTPQSATINTAFAAPLVATVRDSGSNPVNGALVTFTTPGSGASGTFAGGVNTATTNGSGVATSAVFTANATAGGPYTVAASVAGVATPANFSLTNTAGAAASITATSGTPQSTTISTAFAAPLVATVKDSGSNPVSGVAVTFNAPASGASGTFAGGVKTATTNASGVATSAVFTANATAGTYTVTATVAGVATPANFSLTNTAGPAASITATSGTPQSATISTAFAAPLVATVKDAGSNPVSGVVVTFNAPASGASGTFAGGVKTATTNASGVATSAVFTANATAGAYTETATVAGVATPANFALTNTAGAAASIAATSGTPQSATISTAFAAPLVATVKDAGSNPVSGVVVTFNAPASGASGTFAGGVKTATTNASGVATSAVFTANATAGAYTVTATVAGVATPANFALTNTAGAAASIAATSGTPQSATISTAFGAPLVATVKDAGSNPVSGVVVTFNAPASGASGTFAGGVKTATTNASGVATSAAFTANATAGAYTITATVAGVATPANFALTNTAGAPTSIAAISGTPQSAAISTAFVAPMVATVKDASSNPVSGVTVTFTAPGSGASGTFAGGVNTAITNASGVATSAVFTANATAGAYTVTATVAGVATPANFAMTNLAAAPASVTATSGTPQSATISTAFAAPLVATVKDAGNNPVNGVTVTFNAPASGASGTFAGGVKTATTNASGVATSAVFTANATAGAYTVTATVAGVATPANFALTNTAGAAASITATSGTPQSATVSTAFAAPLVATVKDAGSNPVSGVMVTFAAPGSGASGTFAGGVNTATTNASGVATSAAFTANATAGAYTVTATVASVATPANFALTNNAGAAASIAATSGTPQSATISTAFAAPLVATVKDAGSNPVSGVVVTFNAPASGASGTFAGGVKTATTNASGVATSAAFTANATAGAYTITATVAGVATPANFALTNTTGPAASIAATSGTPQGAAINAAFAAPLVATVKDAGNNPVNGVTVTFNAPASGASGSFAGGVKTAITNGSGVATSVIFTANATMGAYTVTAAVAGVATPANFSLTNNAGPAASIAATAGTPQGAAINTAFTTQLQATVKDAGSNPVSGVIVTFTAPGSGASGTFAGGVNTATTNASGVATAAAFTANGTVGAYTVTATVAGVATPANFSLTNNAGAAASITATGGTPQSTTISTTFAASLVATVKDAGSNPVSGVTVTFNAPASGASGTFAGGVKTATTNASGVATSAVFTANATAGAYTVTATVAGVATPANFALTNAVGAAASVIVTSGGAQSVAINTAFAALTATVKDSGNNGVSGVTVTFTAPGSGASGTFTGGLPTANAVTDATGLATAPTFTANATAGGPYTVTATVAGIATPANFSLTNTAGPAASITATSGTPQSATISTAFAAPLVATVKDAGNNPVSGVTVTFNAPASGPSGAFAGGVKTATTNASGVATSAVFTANSTAGAYTITATVAGVATPANFALTNTTGPAASIAATSGTPQSAAISTAFGAALVATVKDAGSNPVSGVTVTFNAPASGASGTFAGGVNTATTNASGVATSAVFTANATAGGPYNVAATVAGVVTPANFALTNTAGAPASVTATAGTPQGTAISTAFTTQLQATVKDAGSNPISGVVVTFTAPGSGASGTFAGGVNTATTNASGVATALVFTANATVGAYSVNATVAGVAAPAVFSLTNNAGPAASITATAGTPQSATINSAFAAKLQATVKDAGSNPVSGVTVTFAAPATGASGSFAGGVTTAVTNASGIAISAVFTANATAGAYTVTASVAGVAAPANFALTNTPGPPASIAATAGTPQSATLSTAFATQLQGTVKDAGGNAVSAAVVTFAAPAVGASGTFAGGVNTATTNASGVATSAVFTANATAGGPYIVAATVAGVATPANFSLTNNNPAPVITPPLAPTSAIAGGTAFPLTITGTKFVAGATVTLGSNPALTPTSISPTQVVVTIPAADFTAGGAPNVTVINPGPGGGPSNTVPFTVNNPAPTLTNATVAGKTHAAGGVALNMVLTGTNFVTTSTVNFGANADTGGTVSNGGKTLTITIPASQVSTAGSVNITVNNPAPGGGISTPAFVFTVDGFAVSGPANTPVKAGQTAMITITVTPTANGFPNPVTFAVTGLPKNATATFMPASVTPNGTAMTTTLSIGTKARGALPPAAPVDTPVSPLLRLLPILWMAAILAGLHAMRLARRTPQWRRYAGVVPLLLLLVTGAVLSGCAGSNNGTPAGAAQLSITATSGTMSVTTAANSVTLTVQ